MMWMNNECVIHMFRALEDSEHIQIQIRYSTVQYSTAIVL